jgi:hypothetical protein
MSEVALSIALSVDASVGSQGNARPPVMMPKKSENVAVFHPMTNANAEVVANGIRRNRCALLDAPAEMDLVHPDALK